MALIKRWGGKQLTAEELRYVLDSIDLRSKLGKNIFF